MRYSIYLILLAAGLSALLFFKGCDRPTSSTTDAPLSFDYYDREVHGAFNSNPKAIEVQSAGEPMFGCFVNVYMGGDAPWKYWSIVLNYPEAVAAEAGGRRVQVKLRVYEPESRRLTRLANCIIPATDQARDMLQELMMEGTRNIRTLDATSGKPPGNTVSGCIIFQGGFYCPDGYCFNSQGNCDDDDPNTPTSLPVLVVEGDDPGSGDTSGPPGGPNSPPDTGGDNEPDAGGGPCYSCPAGGSGPGDPCAPTESGGIPFGCEDPEEDCAGVEGGVAYKDTCGNCVGGTTGKQSCCASFEKIMESILNTEGGYNNNRPSDRGGPTNKGISWLVWKAHAKKTLGKEPTLQNLINIEDEEAKKIYRSEFWNWTQVTHIKDGDLARMFFDFFITGPKGITGTMQQTLIGMGYYTYPDSAMGNNTRKTINKAISDGKVIELTNSFKQNVWDYYHRLANNPKRPSQKKNEKGWKNRVTKYPNKTKNKKHNLYCNV